MSPYPIMHALFSQRMRPVKRLAAAKSNLIHKTFLFLFFFLFLHKDEVGCCTQKPTVLRSPLHLHRVVRLPVCTVLMQIPATSSKSA